MSIKSRIKAIIPAPALRAIQKYRELNALAKYKSLTTKQIFTHIYEQGVWGTSDDPTQRFYSGSGSHEPEILAKYIESIKDFLNSFDVKPNVVDLGCGDFYVGSTIREFCGNYTACDIVPSLIEFNRIKYQALGVDFRVLDLTEDDLPKGDVVFIRQVLQHLSNDHIKRVIPKLAASYKFLVLTEHLPDGQSFTPNLDKPAGPDIRLGINSGLVLTKPPFNLKPIDSRVLCEVTEYGCVIRTTLYTLS